MSSEFLNVLYNFTPSEAKAFLHEAGKQSPIDEDGFEEATCYIKSKELLLQKKNRQCIEASTHRLDVCKDLMFRVLYYKLIGDSHLLLNEYLNATEAYTDGILELQGSEQTVNRDFCSSLYFSLALLSLICKQNEQCSAYLNKGVKFNPDIDLLFKDLYPFLNLFIKEKKLKSGKHLKQLEESLEKQASAIHTSAACLSHILLSYLYEDREDYQSSIRHCERALELGNEVLFLAYDHNRAHLLEHLISLRLKQGRYRESLDLYALCEGLEIDRRKYEVIYKIELLKIEALLALGRDAEAFEAFRSITGQNYFSVLAPLQNNLKIYVNSFMNKILAEKELVKNLELLEKTKTEFRQSKEQRTLIKEYSAKLSAIRNLVEALYRERSVREMYAQIKDSLNQIMKFDSFAIGFFDDRKELVTVDFMIYQDYSMNDITLPIALFPLAQELIQSGESLSCNHCSEAAVNEAICFGIDTVKIESLIAFPLKDPDSKEVFGFCMVQSKAKNTYSDLDFGIFETFATVLSSKLFHARNREKLEREKEAVKKARIMLSSYNEKMENLAFVDPITGLYNKEGLYRALSERFSESKDSKLNLAFLDPVSFRFYNERYGHQRGDEFLFYLKELIAEHFGYNNSAFCRYDGDKFVVVSYRMKSKLVYQFFEGLMSAALKESPEADNDWKIDLRFGFSSLTPGEFFGERPQGMEESLDLGFRKLKQKGTINRIAFLNLRNREEKMK